MYKFKLVLSILLILLIYKIYYTHLEYYSQILSNSYKKDYTRWILSDKYVGKEYAKLYGFNVSKTYQLEKYAHNIKFDKGTFVVKPTDLCDSHGVFLIKDNIDLKTNKMIDKNDIIKKLQKIRSEIYSEYYMHDKMYEGLIPFSGYIVEELLLDEYGELPYDYKCYVFGGKLYFIAVTYNRIIKNNEQHFNSLWFDRHWNPIKFNMIKKGYKYSKIDKPLVFDKLINLVENMGKNLKRHCRIDVYIINNKIYLGEFTFFCGAILHTFLCNLILGIIWKLNPDDYSYTDKKLLKIIPKYYNNPY